VWQRVAARFVDSLVIVATSSFLNEQWRGLVVPGLDEQLTAILRPLAAYAPIALYLVWDGATVGSSPGKRALGIRMVRVHDGRAPGLLRMVVRSLAVPAVPFLFGPVVSLAFWFVEALLVASPGGRTIRDYAAGTRVVRLVAPERAPQDAIRAALRRERPA
jgi:uncharacterized RDD family membrane protein YckC